VHQVLFVAPLAAAHLVPISASPPGRSSRVAQEIAAAERLAQAVMA